MVHQGHLMLNSSHLGCRRRRHLRGPVGSVHHRFVPCAFLVRPQARQLGIRALTHVALVGSLPGVQADVVTQRGGLAEATVAETTHEGLVERVDAHVGAQIASGVKASVADDAAHPASGSGGGGRRRTRRGTLTGMGVI